MKSLNLLLSENIAYIESLKHYVIVLVCYLCLYLCTCLFPCLCLSFQKIYGLYGLKLIQWRKGRMSRLSTCNIQFLVPMDDNEEKAKGSIC